MNGSVAAGAAAQAHGDLALDVLERKLQLLQRQRQISALRCQLFLDQLDLAMAECTLGVGDCSDSDDDDDDENNDKGDEDGADCSESVGSSSEHDKEYEEDSEDDAHYSRGFLYGQEDAMCGTRWRLSSSWRPSSCAESSLPAPHSAYSSAGAAGGAKAHHLHRGHYYHWLRRQGHRSVSTSSSPMAATPHGHFRNHQSAESSPRPSRVLVAAWRGTHGHQMTSSLPPSQPPMRTLSHGRGRRFITQHSAAASPRTGLEPLRSVPRRASPRARSTPSSPKATIKEFQTRPTERVNRLRFPSDAASIRSAIDWILRERECWYRRYDRLEGQ